MVNAFKLNTIFNNLKGYFIMKTYTITVNGTAYEVTVEEGTGTGAAPVVKSAAPVAAPKPVAVPVASGTAGAVKVNAPMPGKILAVKANAGQAVKKGDVIIVLEAMKMENDIVAPQDGTIASVSCAVGDQVEAGALLASLN